MNVSWKLQKYQTTEIWMLEVESTPQNRWKHKRPLISSSNLSGSIHILTPNRSRMRFAAFKHLNSNRQIPPVCRSHEHAYYSSLFAQRLFFSCALARAVGWIIHKTALLTHLVKLARTSFGCFASAHSLVCFWRKMMPYHHVKSETHQHGILRICTDALYRNQMSQNISYWSPRSSHREMSGLEEGSFRLVAILGLFAHTCVTNSAARVTHCTHVLQERARCVIRRAGWNKGERFLWLCPHN